MNVIIKKCNTYDEIKLKKIMIEIFNDLGGIETFIKPKMRVALKPNLLMPKNPEDAVTTHPLLVKVIASLVLEAGGVPFVIDSPGGMYTKSWLQTTYKSTGMKQVADELDIELNLNLRSIEINNENALIHNTIQILKPLYDADYIINIPKLKTHGMMVLTGAVKNMFGAVPGEIKAEYHMNYPDYNDFAKSLIDIYTSIKPQLNIMDGIIAMDGAGPSGGNPYSLGLILASNNAYTLDHIASKIIGLKISEVPILKILADEKLMDPNINNIKLSGDIHGIFEFDNFHIPMKNNPNITSFFTSPLLKKTLGFIKSKPIIIKKNCTNCNTCVKACPAKTIFKTSKTPIIKLDKCIRCFCCQELCPQSTIKIKKPILLDFLMKITAQFLILIKKRKK